MDAVFIELPPFERYRSEFFTDDEFDLFQCYLLENPRRGSVIQGAGGLRKVRFEDPRRGKGKRGGVRVIYHWWQERAWFVLFTVYDKNQQDDLTVRQVEILRKTLDSIKKEERL